MFDNSCPSPDYLEFSFQGLTFWLHNSDLTVNKGAAQSEIYGRGTPITSDTSDKAESFSFTGILSGNDILAQENAFRLAAKMPLPHIIVHPSFGVIIANTQSVKFGTDYKGSLGITTVTIDGNEWGEDLTCGFDLLNLALATLIVALSVTFFTRYLFDGVPSWRMKQVQDTAEIVENAVNNNTSYINGAVLNQNENWSFRPQPAFDNTVKRVQDLKPSDNLRSGLIGIIRDLRIPVNFSPVVNLQDALIQSTRLMAIVKLIEVVKDKKYLTANHAWADRNIIVGALRAEINAASNVGSFELLKAMYDLEKAYITDFISKNNRLSPVITHNFNTMNNSISIAHQLYGDGSRFKEIEELNPHLTPLFMSGAIYAAAR